MMDAQHKIAAIANAGRAATESLLAAFAAEIRGSGVKVVGLLAETPNLPDGTCGAGVLRDIVSGRHFSIRLDIAPENTSCLLDASGVTAACREVLDQIPDSDLVLLSKFGKLEAMGLGLAAAFEKAVTAEKPLLTSVSRLHYESWRRFAPDATEFKTDKAALLGWWQGIGRSGVH